jgi:hypothetical protein
MRRGIRAGTRAAAASVLAGGILLIGAPAWAATVYLQLHPSTVMAGKEVGLRASCTDNLKAASATGQPTGTVTLNPSFGFLTATVRVPAKTRAGAYKIRLTCPSGATASATLHVVANVQPTQGPATGFGGTAGSADAAGLLVGGGLAAIVAGAGLGVLTLRRRRAA